MTLTTAIGYVAGFLTTLAFLPQVIKTWRTRSTDDISMAMLCAFCGGVALWVAYGLLLEEVPIVLFNLITLALALVLLRLKIEGLRRNSKQAP